MGTLTYGCRRCHQVPCRCPEGPDRPTDVDLDQVVADIAAFRRRVRARWSENPPMAIVVEHHKDGHLHVHFAFGRFLDKRELGACWPHGWVDLRKFRAKGIRTMGARERARSVAGYLTAYLKKDFTEGHQFQRHRYSTTRGITAPPRRFRAHRRSAGLAWLSMRTGGAAPVASWDSSTCDHWDAPPVLLIFYGDDMTPLTTCSPPPPITIIN